MKKILREILLFRIEYFITPLFVELLVLSIKYAGFYDIRAILLDLVLFIQIPMCFLGFRTGRRMLYKVLIGKVSVNDYED